MPSIYFAIQCDVFFFFQKFINLRSDSFRYPVPEVFQGVPALLGDLVKRTVPDRFCPDQFRFQQLINRLLKRKISCVTLIQYKIRQLSICQRKVHPHIMNPSRKRRIAAGSGRSIEEVNRLIKQIDQMQKMMRQMTKGGKGSKKRRKMKGLPGLGGMPMNGMGPAGGMGGPDGMPPFK